MDAEQTQSDSYYNFLAWLEVNKRKVMIWAAAALVVVIVAVAVVSYQQQKERRASEALSDVRSPSTGAAPPPPGTADAYLKVSRDHAGTEAAGRALLLGAATKFQEGAYADAQKLYEQFIRDYPASRWLAVAHFGVASSLDAQGKTADATRQFEQVRRQFPNDPVSDETKLALGRLYETQDRPADAYKLYDELLKANPYGGLGSEAGLRQAELVEKHPELAKTNLPPSLTSLPMTSMTNMMVPGTNRPPTNRVQIRPMTNTMQRSATNAPLTMKTQIVNIPLTTPTNPPAAAKP
jgi:tetratricopeptide (TPR) repeat protein